MREALTRKEGVTILLLDALIWGLIVFPLLTGGLWIHQPGLKIELSELTVPVVLVTLVSFLVAALPKKGSLQQLSSARLALVAWRAWERWLGTRPKVALCGGAAAVAALWAAVSLRRHGSYGSGAADLGIFTNAIWNLTHGNGYVSSVKDGISLFADHQSPIFWLLAPLFRLFPAPETLLVAQAAGLAAGGIAIHYLARQYRGGGASAALPILYWAYLPVRNANAFDFHPEVLMLPLFLCALTGLQSPAVRARLLGVSALILALGCKESAGPVATGIGMAWIAGAGPERTRQFTRRIGWALAAIGVAVFLFDTKAVPALLGTEYPYMSNYRHFGGGLGQVLLAPLLHPLTFLSHVFGPARLRFLAWTLAPLGFLPLLHWRCFLAAVPGYLMLFLGEGDHRVSTIYHYGIEPGVGLFWATAAVLGPFLEGRFRLLPRQAVGWILFWSLAAFGRSELYRVRVHAPSPHHQWLSAELVPSIRADARVAASGALVPHLATRLWVHHLPRIEKADCVIWDPEINNWPLNTEEAKVLEARLAQQSFRETFRCGKLRVFESSAADIAPCLVRSPDCKRDPDPFS